MLSLNMHVFSYFHVLPLPLQLFSGLPLSFMACIFNDNISRFLSLDTEALAMLALHSGQPSFPTARAGRPRPDCGA